MCRKITEFALALFSHINCSFIQRTVTKPYFFCSFFLFFNGLFGFDLNPMASPSSSHKQNQDFNAFSVIDTAGERRKVCESSKLFDVFINHRGPDVKATLATQIYNSLQQLGIEAFLDSEEKELGNSFPSIIETAIRSAKVHIAIFSKRYAESAWCLNELLLMLESTAKIIPVFYQVKPSDLRHIETGVYAGAFMNYKEKGRYLEKLDGWKEALRCLSLIAGEEFNNDYDCRNIVAAVKKEVHKKTCLHVAEYPVGLNNLVEDFEKRCLDELVQDFESQCGREEGNHKAQVIGIFGMGGAGKTTLAKELFNRKGWNYTRTSFLFDVREKSVMSQLTSLQGKLIKDLFDKMISFTSTEEGTAYLKDHLRRSALLNILIVVDDIDHVEQLNALGVMDILESPSNSLIIVTTRHAGVLVTAGITVGYNMKGMDRNSARELFCWHAFRQANPCSGYEVLVKDFVNVCGGLPLSLQVLGRHVHGRPHSYWSSELIKVTKTLPRDIKQRLLISFDALDDDEKQVFMDTACFFVGQPKSIAEKVWEQSGWDAQHALEKLKDKCLVEEIDIWHGDLGRTTGLRMHDHLRSLGGEMALQLSPPHRLWRPHDLRSLECGGFKNIMTKTNLRCFHSFFDESMDLGVTFFLGQSDSCLKTSDSLIWLPLERNSREPASIHSWIPLRKLHYLRIHRQARISWWENEIQAPAQMKELPIFQTSSKDLPDFHGISDNLENVLLDARGLPIQGLSLLQSLNLNISSLYLRSSTLEVQQADTKRGERILCESLFVLNFTSNGGLNWNNEKAPMSRLEKIEISDEKFVFKILISGIHSPSLKSIELHQMENLVEVDLTTATTLNSLDIRNCRKLQRLTATSDLPNLMLVNINQCQELKQLSLGHLSCLERIAFVDCERSTSVSAIPYHRNLVGWKVKNFDMGAVVHFKRVSGVSGLKMLAQLKISGFPKLQELRLRHLSCLEKITIKNCYHLKYLFVSGIECLESITIERNMMVKYFELVDCQNLKTAEFYCEELVELSIRHCPELKELPVFKGLSCLERIVIDECGKLKCLQLHLCPNLKSVSGDSEITWLLITGCPELEELPSLSRMSYLEQVGIYQCENIQNIRLPTTLIHLSVKSCGGLRVIAGTDDLMKLRKLIISNCPKLEELPCPSRMKCLEKIVVDSCEKIQNIRLPTNLISLFVKNCRKLQTVAGACDLTELRELTIRECPELEELPWLARVKTMEKIEICQCEKIQNILLPTTIISLSVQSCRDLQIVAGTSDLREIRDVTIRECPELVEFPCPSRVEKIEIYQCEKVQNIRLPTTLISLSIESCRNLQTVAGKGDLQQLRRMNISGCPELEEITSLSKTKFVEQIVIDSCEKLQSIAGIEELHASKYTRLSYCRNAVIRNSIHKLKSVRSYSTVLMGTAVDGAESRLNENLFCEANIGIDGVSEIGTHRAYPELLELSAVIVCFMVSVDGSTSARNINESLQSDCYEYFKDYPLDVREGGWIITMVACDYWLRCFYINQILHVMRRHGILKKGIQVAIRKDEDWKSVQVLSTIVDMLYH